MSNHPGDPEPGTEGWKRWKGWIGFALGLTLLVAAGVVIASTPGMFNRLWTGLAHAPPWAVVVIVLGPVLSWLLVGMCLQQLLRRHGEIGKYEMLMLVGSAWLLNHLPMRPGLVGRVGYHKVVNGIRIRDAVESTLWSVGFSAVSNGLVIAMMLLVPDELPALQLGGILCAPIAVFGVLSLALCAASINHARFVNGFVFRYADLLVWFVRYAAVFAALGLDATPVQIAMVTAVSQFAQLIPITGGGLGLREWGVGITARQGGHAMQAAIGADLINRAIETLWVIPIGLCSTWWVTKRFKRHTESLSRIPDASPSR